MQGQTEHAGHHGDEPLARGQAEGDRGVGRVRPTHEGLAALRGPVSGHHNE